MPKVIQVIQSEVPRGRGVQDDVYRIVTQYHSLDGDFLAELDPCNLTVQSYGDGLAVTMT